MDVQDIRKTMACNFFQNLYSMDSLSVPTYSVRGMFPSIKSCDLNNLVAPVNLGEVRAALFNMKSWKAPEPDGFHAGFFQSQWSYIGISLFKKINKIIMTRGMVDESIGSILISLIPKIPNPKRIADFRPISPCNVIYKVVTKVIANRLKHILPYVISQNQTNFLPGRHITSNIYIAQEVR